MDQEPITENRNQSERAEPVSSCARKSTKLKRVNTALPSFSSKSFCTLEMMLYEFDFRQASNFDEQRPPLKRNSNFYSKGRVNLSKVAEK
mmetsp:Transcript_9553/g.20053  ORF Transcript_9553/g.20053 Transcript_9553/m.20053 type:complete len:90 (-) Transcript_9553:210-479(-)